MVFFKSFVKPVTPWSPTRGMIGHKTSEKNKTTFAVDDNL